MTDKWCKCITMTTWGELDRSVHKTSWTVLACCTKVTDVLAKRAFGVLIYLRKAALCHLPSVWIMESSMHTMVAAPIRKLYPAYWCAWKPDCNRSLILWTKTDLVSTLPLHLGRTALEWNPLCANLDIML